jgi:hypothetical protein
MLRQQGGHLKKVHLRRGPAPDPALELVHSADESGAEYIPTLTIRINWRLTA